MPPNKTTCSFAFHWTCATTGTRLFATGRIDMPLAVRLDEEFGVPESMKSGNCIVRPSSGADLDRLRNRGIHVEDAVIRPDYVKIAARAAPYLLPLARSIVAQLPPGADVRSRVAALVGLVQVVRYAVPPDCVEGRLTLGLRTPLLTLAMGEGDCDSKACLAAALLRSVSICDVALVIGRGHALLGAAVPHRSGDAAIVMNQRNYVVTEVTTLCALGKIDREEALAGREYTAVPS